MLDAEILNTYNSLKASMDAVYKVFKKDPSLQNASKHAMASQAFTDFCVSTLKDLVGDTGQNNKEDVLLNIEEYKTCKKCGSELLYMTGEKQYIASSDFVEGFPGWCYDCLLTHCTKIDCSACKLIDDPSTCTFQGVKNFNKLDN